MVGAGGIGFDVSEFLVTDASPRLNLEEWSAEWGVADPQEARGALTSRCPRRPRGRCICCSAQGAAGRRLGKTTGWVHRAALRAKGVQQVRA